MTNFARIIDNVAVDVSPTPQLHFHPTIAAEFVAVPDTVQCGWRKSGNQWSAPTPPEPAPAVNTLAVSPVQFKLLFTSAERVAIRAARPNDPMIDDFFGLLDDPRLEEVRLGQPSVRQMLEYLHSEGYIAQGRIDQILAGVAP